MRKKKNPMASWVKQKKIMSGCSGVTGSIGICGCPVGEPGIIYPTWEEICKMESGATLKDWVEDGIRCVIKRGPASLCAYLGVPVGHPLANNEAENLPLRVHGGLTFGKEGDGKYFPTGFYWYGWDYAHSGDYVFYYDEPPLSSKITHASDKKWLLQEVEQEVKSTVYDFKKLMELAEKSAKHLWIDMSEIKSENS